MITKIFRSIYFYHVTLGVLLIGILSVGTFYFISSGLSNSEYTSSIFIASNHLVELKDGGLLKSFQENLSNNKLKSAQVDLKKINSSIESINDALNIKDQNFNLETKTKSLSLELHNITTQPSTIKLLTVFASKMRKFDEFVKRNDWKTLTRMSSRLIARIKKFEKFDIDQYARINRAISHDIGIMRNVTESSVLVRSTKSIILLRLKSLSTELEMLDKYINDYKTIQNLSTDYLSTVDKWHKSVSPEVSVKLMNLQTVGKTFLLGVVSLIVFLSGLFVMGFAYLRSIKKKTKSLLGREVISLIKNSILGNERHDNLEYSSDFYDSMSKIKNHVTRRMNLGNILQNSIPFPAFMLDSNMKVLWANQYFSDEWKIPLEDINRELISLDYLARYTNLEDPSPITDAFENGIAGIYQLNLLGKDNDVVTPYEMYVCPTFASSEDEEKRVSEVVVFFYSMSAYEDSIQRQAKSIISPIKKTLNALINYNYNHDFSQSIKSEFNEAQITDLHDMIEDYNEKNSTERNSLLSEIERLESELQDNHKVIADAHKIQKEQNYKNKEFAKILINTKKSVISLIEIYKRFSDNSENFSRHTDSIYIDIKQSNDAINRLEKTVDKFIEDIPNLSEFKENINLLRNEYIVLKRETLEAIDRLTLFKHSNSSSDSERLSESLSQLKRNVKELVLCFDLVDKYVRQIDVKLTKSKMSLNVHSNEKKGSRQINVDAFRQFMKDYADNVDSIFQSGSVHELELVENLRTLYRDYQEIKRIGSSIYELTDFYKEESNTHNELTM